MKKTMILTLAAIGMLVSYSHADEAEKSDTCIELMEWIVDGNEKSHAALSTFALNIVAVECLGREADPNKQREIPKIVVDTFNAKLNTVGI